MLSRWILAVLTISAWCQPQMTTAADPLTIGSLAPALDIEHWVQTGEGAFPQVTTFAPDKVYVVEFWATWCGPCVSAMPHIAELQQKYAAQGVQVVSISDEPLETVQAFLDRQAPAQNAGAAMTFRELTKGYCLTCDPDDSCGESYMRAAGQNGIPCAFLVGKTGLIEWVGHPMSIDPVLEQVVAGTWDRAAFAEQFRREQEWDLLQVAVMGMVREKDYDGALAAIEPVWEASADPQTRAKLSSLKINILLAAGRSEAARELIDTLISSASDGEKLALLNAKFRVMLRLGDEAEAFEAVTALMNAESATPAQVNGVAWMLVQLAAGKQIKELSRLTAILPAVQQAADAAQGSEKASVLDTLAHLQFLAGELPAAIATQTAAVALLGDDVDARSRQGVTQYLDFLKRQAETAAEPKSEPTAEPAASSAAPQS